MTDQTIPSRKLTHDGAQSVGYLLMDGARILAQNSASAVLMR